MEIEARGQTRVSTLTLGWTISLLALGVGLSYPTNTPSAASVRSVPFVNENGPVTGRVLAALPGNDNGVSAVAFSKDGRTLVAGGVGGLIWSWDVGTWPRLQSTEQKSR